MLLILSVLLIQSINDKRKRKCTNNVSILDIYNIDIVSAYESVDVRWLHLLKC